MAYYLAPLLFGATLAFAYAAWIAYAPERHARPSLDMMVNLDNRHYQRWEN